MFRAIALKVSSRCSYDPRYILPNSYRHLSLKITRICDFFPNFMCSRYRRTTSQEELARLYHIPIPSQTDLPISYNIAPSQKVLTIRFNPQTQQRSLDVNPLLGEGP
jgi:hypothetical protein